MRKAIFFLSFALVAGCSTKRDLIVDGTSLCENRVIGGFQYKDFIDVNGKFFNEINCYTIIDNYQLGLLDDYVKRGGTPNELKRWSEALQSTSLTGVLGWWLNDFQLIEANAWSDIGVSPLWAKKARGLGFSIEKSKKFILLGLDISHATEWDKTGIPIEVWDLWISDEIDPQRAKKLTEEYYLDGRVKVINYLSELKFKKLENEIEVNGWVCSKSNQVGILKTIVFGRLEIVIRRKSISFEGYDIPRYSLFRPVRGVDFKLVRKAERIKGDAAAWAACPETIVKMIL